jgi:uridine kinase
VKSKIEFNNNIIKLMVKLIGLSGRKSSGKTYLVNHIVKNFGYVNINFADSLHP